MTTIQTRKKHIAKDFFIIVLSIVVTIILMRTGAIDTIVMSALEMGVWGSFVAGIFFTSIFTITPASMVLAGMAETHPLLQVAVFGAAGAVLGDLIIYLYVKDTLAPDILYLVHNVKNKKFRHFIRLRLWRWLTPLLAAIVIASPLPDELGLAMLGLSRMKTFLLIPISFTFNLIGILLIALAIGQL